VFPAYIEFGGHLGLNVLGGAVSVDANVVGQFWIDSADFNIEGGAQVCVPVLGCNGASGIVSSRGVIGCWDQNIGIGPFSVGTISIGGGYRYGDGWPSIYFSGCTDNFGDYRVSHAADIAQATGAQTFNLPPGLPAVMFRIVGSADAPAFTISGPHGEHAITGPDDTVTGDRRFVLMRSHRFDMTWLGIKHPAGGPWTITPLPGSSPIVGTYMSRGLPPASVRAAVAGHGYARTLHFSIRRRPSQVVRFIEVAPAVDHNLGATTAATGTLRFTPAIGPAGRRTIVALVTLGGMPSKRLVVASYIAPGPPRAQRPPHLRLARRGSALGISWSAGANTDGYAIVVMATDGRRLLFHLGAGARAMSVAGFSVSGAIVSVRGVGPDGNSGPAATGRLARLGPPGRIGGLSVTGRGRQIRISWRRSARALDYRVVLTITGTRGRLQLVTGGHAISFRVMSTRVAVLVSVRGEGAMGLLGPSATARYTPPRRRPPTRRHRPA
jgi:hypothetical protein